MHDAASEKHFWAALHTETELAAAALGESTRSISTIFVGGGTPSMIGIEQFANWLHLAKSLFHVPDNIEFSFECNPDSVTLELMQTLKSLGVTRPTIGIESFDTRALKSLNRPQTVEDCQRAVYYAHALGFRTFGVDLIFGLPNQTTKKLSKDLDQLVDLEPPHISYYQLTVEPGTRLHEQVSANKVRMPGDQLMHAMYKGGYERFLARGYERYEVSSFAKPGHQSEHNKGYWTGRNYLGFGPSAHSFMDGKRFVNTPDLRSYVRSLRKGELPRAIEDSGSAERMMEAVMVGLRTTVGIDRVIFTERYGQSLDDLLDRRQYDMLVESGHLLPEGTQLRLSDEGMLLADEITRRILR